MIEQSKSNIFPFFILSVIIHVAVFYALFHQKKENVFIQVPVEVSFYSPAQKAAAVIETDKQNKIEEIKKQPKKKEEIAVSKKQIKKEEKKKKKTEEVEKKEEKKIVKDDSFGKRTVIDATEVNNLPENTSVSDNRNIMFDDTNFKYNYYTNSIVKKIGKFWQWSSSYASFRSVVYFKIDKSGVVHSVKIKESSGDDDFDQNALRSVQLASPFAPLPEGYAENDLGVYFEFKFR